MKKIIFLPLIFFTLITRAQSDSSMIRRIPADSSRLKMNMDAVYNRPFLTAGKMPVALGGYLEANSSYFSSGGVTDGLSFQLPRLTLFVSSSVRKRIKFLSEIEFEEGGKEIGIEFASMDVELHPLLNLRGGVIMNPIGAFNQNHDGPKWEFVSRPLSATTIIPATWSNVGFGAFGKYARNNFVWAYELYATNGFDDKIISNPQGRTWLPASKNNPERFSESFNGVPLITAKTALRHRRAGEIGLSCMSGVYNQFEIEGIKIDKRRSVTLFAVDFNTLLRATNTYLTGEWVWALVDVPQTYSQSYGKQQRGGFFDIVQPVLKKRILGWDNSTINVSLRTEYVDYNAGYFRETGKTIYDHLFALTPGLSFRPSAQTVVRLNYSRLWQTDLLGNPAKRTAGIQIGFSTYF